MSTRIDGLIDYTLGKDYGEHKAGEVLAVDPDRKEWLDKNGYGEVVSESGTPVLVVESPVIRRKRPLAAELETPPNIPDLTIRET